MTYYKRYLIIAIPYTLAIWATYNYIPVMVDIPILLGLVASMPIIMRKFLMKEPFLKSRWVCTICGNQTRRSPCPRCNSSQFKIV